MSKKIITVFIILIIIALFGFIYFVYSKSNEEKGSFKNNNEENNIAVIYFSATGNTAKVAAYISDEVNGSLIEIIPEDEYTEEDLDYSNDECRASSEQNDEDARPLISNEIDVSSYDVIFLGYPIWWNDVPKIILTFLDSYDLSGKTVIPFCTSGGSGINTSLNTLKEYNPDVNWIEGERLDVSKDFVIDWLNELEY